METGKHVSLVEILIPFSMVFFIISLGVVMLYQQYQKTIFKQRLEKEAMKLSHQQELLAQSILVQETERKRIATDLHDELGAILSIIRMNLLMMQKKETAQAGNLSNIVQLSETAIASVRNISHQLMPPQLEAFGLTKTLESVINSINNKNSLYIQYHFDESLPELPWVISLNIYRILMELINNTIKHANASHVQLNLTTQNNILLCHYNDNGKGMPPEIKGDSLGLVSIETRVHSLRGHFEYGNAATGNGFHAFISLPF